MSILDRPFATTVDGEVHTFRGKNLEQLLPRIREELGADAVILRQRDGLLGGVGGFFATRFVEVEARAGAARVDLYDEAEDDDAALLALAAAPREETAPPREEPAAPREEPSLTLTDPPAASAPAPAAQAPVLVSPEPAFSAELEAAVTQWAADVEAAPAPRVMPSAPAPAPAVIAPAPLPAPAPATTRRGRPRLPRQAAAPRPVDRAAAGAVIDELTGLGATTAFASDIVGRAAAHPALGGGVRSAARTELAHRIRPAASLPAAGAAVAFIGAGGAGKSMAAAALATAYRTGSALPVSVLTLTDEYGHRRLADALAADGVPVSRGSARVGTLRQGGMVIVDTPAISPGDPAALSAMADDLATLALDAIYAVLPATLSQAAARRALAGLAQIGIDGIVISHADESDQLATLIELADAQELPVVYLTAGADHHRCLIAADPSALAQVLLP